MTSVDFVIWLRGFIAAYRDQEKKYILAGPIEKALETVKADTPAGNIPTLYTWESTTTVPDPVFDEENN